MMKTCKTVLRCAREFWNKGNTCPQINELVRTTGLTFDEVIAACRTLKSDGYFEYTHAIGPDGKCEMVNGIVLCTKGQKSKEFIVESVRQFLINNLIGIIALTISIIALLKP